MKKALLWIFGLTLTLDSLWLLSLGKINFGILLPLVLGVGFILCALFDQPLQQYLAKHANMRKLWRGAWACFWVWLLTLAGFFGYMQHQINQAQDIPQVSAIMVLGGGIEQDQPTPSVNQRLDAAYLIAQYNPKAPVIMTGGVGMNDTLSEAEVMQAYMQRTHQMNAERIYQEAKSTSTEENFSNSKAILTALKINLDQPIAIVTSDFHLARAAAIAKHQGYSHILTVSAPTPLYIRYNSWLREYFAYLSGWLLREY